MLCSGGEATIDAGMHAYHVLNLAGEPTLERPEWLGQHMLLRSLNLTDEVFISSIDRQNRLYVLVLDLPWINVCVL